MRTDTPYQLRRDDVLLFAVGVFAGYLMGVVELGVSGDEYLQNSKAALKTIDIVSSLSKAAVFGLIRQPELDVQLMTAKAFFASDALNQVTVLVGLTALPIGDVVGTAVQHNRTLRRFRTQRWAFADDALKFCYFIAIFVHNFHFN